MYGGYFRKNRKPVPLTYLFTNQLLHFRSVCTPFDVSFHTRTHFAHSLPPTVHNIGMMKRVNHVKYTFSTIQAVEGLEKPFASVVIGGKETA